MTDFDVLRVFCGPGGEHGNELGVVREGSVMPDPEERQAFAAKLGFSETVFVADPRRRGGPKNTPTPRRPVPRPPSV
ncbi:PhzF family phenazine biosynthesis protein, partial [Streptomyces mirabilis]